MLKRSYALGDPIRDPVRNPVTAVCGLSPGGTSLVTRGGTWCVGDAKGDDTITNVR